MTENFNLEKLKFPIGHFDRPTLISDQNLAEWIGILETFPKKMKSLTAALSTEQLNWRYRPEGWSIKQVVHHCADSHINSFVRFKLTLTESIPTIKPYNESEWVQLEDGLSDDITASLQIIEGIHAKWVILIKSLNQKQLSSAFFHPESNKTFTLNEITGFYAWHCTHHLAHIKQALQSEGQFLNE